MKKLMIAGAIIGFSTGMVLGTFQGVTPTTAFWRASIAAVACGYLLRWWGKVWIRALHAAYFEKNSAREATTPSQN